MYRATVTVKGLAPLSQSRQHYSEKLDGESHEEYDQRTWREKCNFDEDGIVHVPAMGLKQAIDLAAKRLEIPDPDNKRAKMTKNFVSDVLVETNLPIGVHKDDMPSITINANVDGRRGSGKRIQRKFPQISKWAGKFSICILDQKIKQDMLERVLAYAGRSIGVGQFRAEVGGTNGRFEITDVRYEQI